MDRDQWNRILEEFRRKGHTCTVSFEAMGEWISANRLWVLEPEYSDQDGTFVLRLTGVGDAGVPPSYQLIIAAERIGVLADGLASSLERLLEIGALAWQHWSEGAKAN